MRQKKRLMLWRGEGITPAPSFANTYSLDFDGVNDYVDCGDIDALDNVSTFTISVWFKLDGTGNNDTIFAKTTDANNRIDIIKHSNGILYFQLHSGGNGYLGVNFSDLGWNHVAMVFDGSQGGTIPAAPYYQAGLQCYLNGSKITTFNVGSGTIPTTTPTLSNNFLIGEYDVSAGYFLEGKVDELSIWSTALTDANISTLWNDGTPNNLNTALATTPVNWYRCGDSGTFFNSNWEIPEQTKINNWSSHSFAFDGVSSYIDLGSDTSLEPASALSVSAWVKRDASMVNYSGIVESPKDTYSDGWVMVGTSTNKVRFYLWTTLGTPFAEIDSAITIDTWYHILGTWDGSTIRIYVNGVLQSTTGVAADIVYASPSNKPATIGHYALNEFPGNIDDVSIYSTDKSSSASAIYNSGVPKDESATSGLVGYWTFDDATFSTNWNVPDNSSNSNNGTSSGMAIDDKVNNAPDNINQGLTSGMVEGDRVEDTP